VLPWDLSLIAPEIALCVCGIVVLLAECVAPRGHGWVAPAIAALGLLVFVVLSTRLAMAPSPEQFADSVAVDGVAIFFKVVLGVTLLLVVMSSAHYFREIPIGRGELYGLLVLITIGLSFMAASTDLVMIYMSIELVSIGCYVLAGYLKRDVRSSEAALKYFLFGAVCSAVMLYGLSLLYGGAGSTNLLDIRRGLAGAPLPVTLFALCMVLVGLGFKIAMVPLHAWAPDVYEGAPTPVTAFLSVAPKIAGVALLLRVLQSGIPAALTENWVTILALASALTMTVGNLGALRQTNIKRMLAYSSIAHAGYMLIGVVAFRTANLHLAPLLYYVLAYVFMNLGAFGVAIIVGEATGTDEISRWAGLARRAPALAAMMAVFLLSLTGIPPMAGFVGKLYVFLAAIGDQRLWWLAVVAIANSVVSLYYYANVLKHMYFGPTGEAGGVPQPVVAGVGVGLCCAMTLLLGISPGPFLDAITACIEIIQ
jgi:proton-translocating NADH-quinone oxidoreductase chain N